MSSPERLVLESTNICNRSCFFCGAAQSVESLERGFMNMEIFARLADEAYKIQPNIISLHGHGEPLMHPNIVEMVEMLSSRKLVTELVTNGDLLTLEMAASLLEAGLDNLIISHPAISLENWKSCRIDGDMAKSDEAISEAIEVWDESNRNLTVRCLVFKEKVPRKVASVREYVKKWSKIKAVKNIEFWLYQPWPEHVLEDRIDFFYANPSVCRLGLESLAVSWSGKVSPCPYDVHSGLQIGDTLVESLPEIMKSKPIRHFRRQTAWCSSSRPELCRKCLINRVPARNATVSAQEYRATPHQMREEWVKNVSRASWLKLVQKEQMGKKSFWKPNLKRKSL